jgi:hypothetical protein
MSPFPFFTHRFFHFQENSSPFVRHLVCFCSTYVKYLPLSILDTFNIKYKINVIPRILNLNKK